MKKKIMSLLFVLVFLIFIGIIDYPFIAQMINDYEESAVVVDLSRQTANQSEEEKDQSLEVARSYNQALTTGLSMEREVPFTTSTENDPYYLSILDIQEDGIMASIEIPKIDVILPIYHGVSSEALNNGVGHLEGSSFPIGGESTHACLVAHRGLSTKRLFTDLDQLEVGDVFFIEVLDNKLTYQVYDVEVVLPDEVESLNIQQGEDLITLITCTPYGSNTHRLYVHGTRIPNEEVQEAAVEQTSGKGFWQQYWWVVLTIVLLVWMVFLLYLVNRSPGKIQREKQK
ncbi:MAG: class C sortase [Lachnospiraceae bacterium]